jgi:hypothetical protein
VLIATLPNPRFLCKPAIGRDYLIRREQSPFGSILCSLLFCPPAVQEYFLCVFTFFHISALLGPCGAILSEAQPLRPPVFSCNSSRRYTRGLTELQAAASGPQLSQPLHIRIRRQDFAPVDAMEIAVAIRPIRDLLNERARLHIIAVQYATLIVRDAALNNGNLHRPSGCGTQVRLSQFVPIPA